MPNINNQLSSQIRDVASVTRQQGRTVMDVLDVADGNADGNINIDNVDRFVRNVATAIKNNQLDDATTQAARQILTLLGQVRQQTPPPIALSRRVNNSSGVINNGRVLDNQTAVTLAAQGAVFNMGAYNVGGMATDALANQGVLNATPGKQGAALARDFWKDNFFSGVELASVFQYMQQNISDPNQKKEFQKAFIKEFANQVKQRFPGQENVIMMQFARFMNNTNWDSNDPMTQGFKNFAQALGTGLVEELYPEQVRDLKANPGNKTIISTYDIPQENGAFGSALLIAYIDEDGQLKTELVPYKQMPNSKNKWSFNFGQNQGVQQQQLLQIPAFGTI